MQRHLGLLLVLLALACVADAFSFLSAARSSALRAASRQESSRVGQQPARQQAARRMAAPSMMAAGGKKKKVLILGGDGCVRAAATVCVCVWWSGHLARACPALPPACLLGYAIDDDCA
jgi:hypothetical protein